MSAATAVPQTAIQCDAEVDQRLWAELWVSLASLLRSYTAVHGLNSKAQATVELGENQIIVRVADRWLTLGRSQADVAWARETGQRGLMRLTPAGRLIVAASPGEDRYEEMDLQAEQWARELMT